MKTQRGDTNLENQVLGKLRLVSPDDPAHTSIDKPEFVARGIDGLNTRQFKVPLWASDLRVCKRCDEATRCGIDVDWNVDTRLLLIFVENFGDLFDWLIMTWTGVRKLVDSRDTRKL